MARSKVLMDQNDQNKTLRMYPHLLFTLGENLNASRPDDDDVDDDEHPLKGEGKCQNVQVGTMDATTKTIHGIKVGSPALVA